MIEEELAMIINHGRLQQEDGEKVCELLDRMYNCYSSYARLSSGLYDRLSAKGKKVFQSILAIACLCLSHEWARNGYKDWDKRKEAAESFCYKNREFFEDLFEKSTGLGLETTNDKEYLPHALTNSCRRQIIESGKAYLLGFLNKWVNVHPTLQQSIVGGCAKGILLKDGKTCLIPPLDYVDMVFPFV